MKYLVTVLLLLPLLAGSAHAADELPRPLFVELYTSQGCSSCPPADAYLAELAKRPEIVAVAFHVTYWDYLGWRDLFGTAEGTERQREYARFHSARPYTPQFIIEGRSNLLVGRDDLMQKELRKARSGLISVPMKITPGTSGQLLLDVGSDESVTGGAELWEIRYRDSASTKIGRGENRGRTVDYHRIVTRYKSLGTWEHAAMRKPLAGLGEDEDGIVVLLQQPGPGAVYGLAHFRH